MSQSAINNETVSGEALFILRNLKENGRLGRSNKLADVKQALEPSVSLEFDSYFFFLRKFHYIAMDREAQLRLTDQGERVVEGDQLDRFGSEVEDFFADQLFATDERTHAGVPVAEPPPPPDLVEDASPPPPPPSVAPMANGRGGRRSMTPAPPPAEDPTAGGTFVGRVERPESHEPVTRREPTASGVPAAPVSLGGSMGGSAAAKGTEVDLRFVKFDPVGQGPLGTVFKGRHNALGLEVAIKELKDIFGYFSFLQRGEVLKRMRREVCAQAQVRHPGVVAVLDQNTEVARPYVVSELLRGSLRERLEQAGGKGLEFGWSMRCFLQMAYALRATHAVGLTHHNLKPENVLFDVYGNAKLTDFGLSRIIEVDPAKGLPQVFVGTGGMGYLSPELIGRSKDVGPGSDVYGLGIVLYEMLTGQVPGRRSPLPSEVNSDVPSKLDPIFDKMTQDRREGRYPDFDAVLDDFYAAFSEGEFLGRGDLVLWSEDPVLATL